MEGTSGAAMEGGCFAMGLTLTSISPCDVQYTSVYMMHSTTHHAPCTMHHAPCTKHHAPLRQTSEVEVLRSSIKALDARVAEACDAQVSQNG